MIHLKKSMLKASIILILLLTYSLSIYSDNFIPPKKKLRISYRSSGRVVGEGENQYFQCLGNGSIECVASATIEIYE